MIDPAPALLRVRRSTRHDRDGTLQQVLLGVAVALALVGVLALGALMLGAAVWLLF